MSICATMSMRARVAVVLQIILCFFTATAFGQGPPAGRDRLKWQLSYSNWRLGDAGVEHSDGSFSVVRQKVSARWSDFSISYSRWDFDWSDVSRLPFGDAVHDPWRSLEAISASVHVLRPLAGRWTYAWGLSAGYVYETDTSDAFGGRVFGGLGYAFNRGTIVRAGAMVSYHPIRTVTWPMIGFDLRTQSGFTASLGFPKTEVRYRFAPAWEVSVSAFADRAVARLADDSVVAPDGYLEATNYMGALGLRFSPSKHLSFNLSWAQSLSRSITFYDEDGHKIEDYDMDRAPGILVGVRWRF